MKQLFYALLLAASIPAAAQRSHIGLEAGLQLSNFTVRATLPASFGTGTQVGKATADLRAGIRAGIVADGYISRDFTLQSGLYFTQKGANDPNGNASYRLSYLELPVLLLAKARLGTGHLFLGGGPFVAVAIGGKYDYGSGSQDLTFGDGAGANFRRIDGGVLVTGGYETKPGVFFRAFVNPSLVNIRPAGSSDNSIRNWGYGFSVGYFFQ